MDVYLFRSMSEPMLRAFTSEQAGTMLPRSLGPWVSYGKPGTPMEQVTAVSHEIQEGLEARGYYLVRTGKCGKLRPSDDS
jgi:hypothetical protein